MFLFIALLSLIGFGVTFYIYESVRVHKKMTCPLGHDCKAVVLSPYGTLMFIRNEVWGMLAYVIMFFAAVLSQVLNEQATLITELILILTVIPMAIFSVILSYVQIAILKKYCSWCMVVNIINVAMFILIVR